MFTDPFIRATDQEIQAIQHILDDVRPGHDFKGTGLVVLRKPVGFYPGASYYNVARADLHPAKEVSLIMGDRGHLVLDGNEKNILAFNQEYPLYLDPRLAVDYIRFFLAHTNGPMGRTGLVESVDDLPFRDEPTPAQRRSLAKQILPLACFEEKQETYGASGTIIIHNNIYTALFWVQESGDVTLEKDRILAENLVFSDEILEN